MEQEIKLSELDKFLFKLISNRKEKYLLLISKQETWKKMETLFSTEIEKLKKEINDIDNQITVQSKRMK